MATKIKLPSPLKIPTFSGNRVPFGRLHETLSKLPDPSTLAYRELYTDDAFGGDCYIFRFPDRETLARLIRDEERFPLELQDRKRRPHRAFVKLEITEGY